jgi:GT2 family glycosyltransferase
VVARFAQLEIEERYERMKSKKYIDFIGSYSAGYRKNIFLKSGGFDENFPMASGEDPELSFKLAESGFKMVFTPKAVVYHKHPSSLGKYLKQKFWRAYWRILLYKKHPGKIKSESYTPQTLKLQIGILYLFFLFLIGSLFSKIYLNVSALLILVLFLSTIELAYKNLRKDMLVGLYSPVIVVLRTVSFGLGLLYGFLRLAL